MVAKQCMGRLFSWSVCYVMQDKGGANDGEEWSYIDEGKWKERQWVE
jgi:hypothetical protein